MKNGGSKQIVARSKEIFERFKAPVFKAFPDAKLKALHGNMVSLLNQDEANASKLVVCGQQLFGRSSAQFHKVLYIQNPNQVVDGEVNKLVLVVLEALPLSGSKAKEVLRGRLITNQQAGLHMALTRLPESDRAAAATAMEGRLQYTLGPSNGYFDTQGCLRTKASGKSDDSPRRSQSTWLGTRTERGRTRFAQLNARFA